MRVIERRPATRCSFCHGDLGGEARRCGGCGTTTHAGCFDDRACPTLGCAGRVAPAVAVAPVKARRPSWRRVAIAAGALAALGLLAVGSIPVCVYPERPVRVRVQGKLALLECALQTFEADHRRQPQRLEQLWERAGNGPYVDGPLLDPWGRPFGLVRGDDRRLRPICWGADGLPGGEGADADITARDR